MLIMVNFECCALCVFPFSSMNICSFSESKNWLRLRKFSLPTIYQAGITDTKGSYKVNKKQYFFQVYSAAVKCQNDSLL